MPELPEVETVVRTLEISLLNETIHEVEVRYPKLLESGSQASLEHLKGRKLISFNRRGKYLCLGLDDGLTWIIHLRMEGKFNLYTQDTEPNKHTHLILKSDHHEVHYLDTRKFSRMALVKDVETYFMNKGLGLEPWDDRLDGAYLYKAFKNKTRVIKATLLDQGIVVGIGNIYADEVLYDTQIHPMTPSGKLSLRECEKLVISIRKSLENAIKAGGTTVRSYTSSLNVSGLFQVELKAYGRYGKPCYRCGTDLDKVKVAGRTSVFCTRCQRVKL